MEYHVFVTSNRSNTHIIRGEEVKTLCGIENEPFERSQPKYPNSEIRATYSDEEFARYVIQNKGAHIDGWRFCKRCIKAYDNHVKL